MKGIATIFVVAFVFAGLSAPACGEDQSAGLETVLEEYAIIKPFSQALGDLAGKAGVNLRVDWVALHRSGVTAESRVMLKGRRATVAKLLDLALLQVMRKGQPLGWYIAEDGSVVLTSAQLARIRQRTIAPRPRSQPQSAPAWAASQPTSRPAASRLHLRPARTAPLGDVIDLIRQQTKINLVANWPALRASGITRDSPVSLQLRNGTIGQVLDLALREVNTGKGRLDSAYWIVDDDILLISTGRELDKRSETRTYEVGPLLLSQPNSTRLIVAKNQSYIKTLVPVVGPGAVGYEPVIGTCSSGVRMDLASTGVTRAQKQASLKKVVRNLIDPEMWQPTGKGSIRFFDTRMVVTQSLLGWKLMELSARGVLSD